MSKAVFVSGTTRGATLEGIGRSFASAFRAVGVDLIEASLLDPARFMDTLRSLNFREVKLVFSWVSMGMDIQVRRDDGVNVNPWEDLRVPFLSLHGDSPAYFFDRHVVRNPGFTTFYGFSEHLELRKRLPHVNGPVYTWWPIPLDEVPRDEIDFAAKKNGTLLFLKNGKDPGFLQALWASFLEPRLLRSIRELADYLEHHLDDPLILQLDDLVTGYFREQGVDIDHLTKLRLLFIAQLDDYVRAVKGTRLATALMDFPVEIRGNNWGYLDFSGKRARCIDHCDYVASIGLIRASLGTLDMSPNTGSHPHDRVMRAYGAHTLCLTNRQHFLEALPHQDRLSFDFAGDCFVERVAWLLDHRAEAVEMGAAVAEAYRNAHPPEQLACQMLDCAAMARLNNLPQRPAGMQDFVVWPPSQI